MRSWSMLLPCLSLTQLASAQSAPPPSAAPLAPKHMTTCEALARDWRNAEIDLARSDVEGLTDDSAPRATMRAIRDNNAIQLAAMTLSLMRENKCALPKRAPSAQTYMLPALQCRTEQMKGNVKAPQCDTLNWAPLAP